MSHPNPSGTLRTGSVVLALTGAAALGFGYYALLMPSLAAMLGISAASAGISLILFIAGIVVIAAAIVLSPVTVRLRASGAILAAVGVLLSLLVGFVGGHLAVRFSMLAAGILVGVVLAGLMWALGLRGRAFAWLALLAVPVLVGAAVPSFALLLIAEFLMAIVAALIVGLGLLGERSRAARDATVRERGAAAEQQDIAQRADEIRKWEEAYALAHDGQKPPAGFMPPVVQSRPSGGVNTIAVLALVFAILGSIVGLILGYVARAQIRRTGEGARASPSRRSSSAGSRSASG
ncbi:hypothetical protein GCM10025881_24010 [Pseudolysinimonas kribbensis]|uniref:Uncharacterized protein n=1 Tax=Pseudolysinimonas kribbensis TaxID=433641 RepID=A0ABQ6K4M5_9MICO|nr:hypothetical protein [Pseudolysinimonas kribbensis]GMA95577.1 hypothetical protein GCM10025881_24010 [Pseudolysinimonas kribbensis]